MNCTIKITAGPEAGQEFEIALGEAVIGRSARCLVRLSSASVSYEHAIISRVGNDYFIENLSANGTYLNNERVTAKSRLRAKDQIRLGQETMARVESLPVSGSAGSQRPILIALVLLVVIVCAAVVVYNPFASGPTVDVMRAYATLQKFADGQSDGHKGKLPAGAAGMLREGWRLALGNAHKDAAAKFQDLYTLFQSTDRENHLFSHFEQDSGHTPTSLQMLLDPENKEPLSDEDMAAALIEFADTMKNNQLSR